MVVVFTALSVLSVSADGDGEVGSIEGGMDEAVEPDVDEEPPAYFGEDGDGNTGPDEPEEYEYIETPHMESTGTFRSERSNDAVAVTNMRVMIEHPTEGYIFEQAHVSIHVNAENVPHDEGYSGMLYFGSGNPYPIPMESLPVGITVTDLAPGNYSVKFMLLDPERQPTGVEADVNFERRAPPGFRAPKPDNSKFDSRIFEISQRFILAEQADPLQVRSSCSSSAPPLPLCLPGTRCTGAHLPLVRYPCHEESATSHLHSAKQVQGTNPPPRLQPAKQKSDDE